MIKAIIFDADNTLYTISTKNAYTELYRYLASHTDDTPSNIQDMHKELISSIKKEKDPKRRTYSYAIKAILNEYNKDTKETTEEALKIFWNQIIEDLKETPTTKKTIIELKKRYILAIASDEFLPILKKKIKRIFGKESESFTEFITPEDTNTMKPSTEYYQIALQKLKIKPEQAIVVGDSYERDILPAKTVGIKTVLLSPTIDGNPDYHIKKMTELKTIIKDCENKAQINGKKQQS